MRIRWAGLTNILWPTYEQIAENRLLAVRAR